MADEVPQPGDTTGGKCPQCGKPALRAFRPFCSRRCADIDLARWLGGSYVIGGTPEDADGDAGQGGSDPL